MTEDEITRFVERSRVSTMATVGPGGMPHLVAMWYAVIDGELWFETKAKSQKAVNLRRDGRLTMMIEDGDTYDTLRGVSIEGRGEIVDGDIWFETKSKSQKAVNIRRNSRCSVMIEDGDTYDTLRGVTFEGVAEILDDPDSCLKVGISVWERYTAPYTEESRPFVEQMMNKRVAVRIRPSRTRSWDPRKLGIPEMPASGSTAEFL